MRKKGFVLRQKPNKQKPPKTLIDIWAGKHLPKLATSLQLVENWKLS